MLITPLTIVNACLASMGESAVNSLDANNIFISSALNSLEHVIPAELSYGWYFNTELVKLQPTVEGYVYVPSDTVGLSARVMPPWLSIRGRRLYDNRKGQLLRAQAPVDVVLIRNLSLEDLPYHAARMVKAAAVRYFQKSFDGDEAKIRDADTEYAEARAMLMAEHIRAVNANMLYQGAVGERIHRQLIIHSGTGVNGGSIRG